MEHIGGLGFYLFNFFAVYVTKVANIKSVEIEILRYPTVPLKLKGNFSRPLLDKRYYMDHNVGLLKRIIVGKW